METQEKFFFGLGWFVYITAMASLNLVPSTLFGAALYIIGLLATGFIFLMLSDLWDFIVFHVGYAYRRAVKPWLLRQLRWRK